MTKIRAVPPKVTAKFTKKMREQIQTAQSRLSDVKQHVLIGMRSQGKEELCEAKIEITIKEAEATWDKLAAAVQLF